MQRSDILKKINDIFIDVLDNPGIVLSDQTTAGDVEGWDSLSHIQIVVSVEKAFKLRFTSREIQSWANVGEMIDCISSKN